MMRRREKITALGKKRTVYGILLSVALCSALWAHGGIPTPSLAPAQSEPRAPDKATPKINASDQIQSDGQAAPFYLMNAGNVALHDKDVGKADNSSPGRTVGVTLAALFDEQRRRVAHIGFVQAERLILSSTETPLTPDPFDLGVFYASLSLFPECMSALEADQATPSFASVTKRDELKRILKAYCALGAGKLDEAQGLLSGADEGNPNTKILTIVTMARQGRFASAARLLEAVAPGESAADPAVATLLPPAMIEIAGYRATSVDDPLFRRAIRRSRVNSGQLARARILARNGQYIDAQQILTRLEKTVDGRLSVRTAVLQQMIALEANTVPPYDLVEAADDLAFRWDGGLTGRELTALRARARFVAGDLSNAFAHWRTLIREAPQSDAALDAQERLTKAIGLLVAADDNEQLIEQAALFLEFVEFAPPGAEGDALIRQYTDRLTDLGLGVEAAELLEHQVFQRLRGRERARIAARLAALHMRNGAPEEALRVIRSTRLAGISEETLNKRRGIEAEALAAAGRKEKALALLENASAPHDRRRRADILWNASRWAEASVAYKVAFEGSREDGHLALRAAVAFGLAGDGAALSAFATANETLLAGKPEGDMIRLLDKGFNEGSFFTVYRSLFETDNELLNTDDAGA